VFLGLDLGTSELKALLLDEHQQVLATSHAALQLSHPQPLWSEQLPHDWWEAVHLVMKQLVSEQPAAMARVQAIGLSGQMHGAVLLDAQEQVLRPAILWNDGRSGPQCERLSRDVPTLAQISGNLAMPGFTAPKLMWVAEHEPDVFARVAKVLLPKDWLRLKLTGEAVSDMSDASGTLWLDVEKRAWSDFLLQATGMRRDQMPRLVEGSQDSATLMPALRQAWAMQGEVIVAGGAGDNAASAVGMGLVHPGEGFVSLGTSGVVFVSGDRFVPNPDKAVHAFCHALPGRWHQMSVMLSAASAVTWACSQLGYDNEASLLSDALSLNIQQRVQAPLFLPYLNGERSPHNNPHACAGWLHVRSAHERADLAYAVVEGVSWGLKDGWLALDASKQQCDGLSLVGGGSRSEVWAQLLADVLQVPLRQHVGGAMGGALGAARLGWLAVGGSVEQVCVQPPVGRQFEPQPLDADVAQRYTRFGEAYRRLYG
jgi:xylulokinase